MEILHQPALPVEPRERASRQDMTSAAYVVQASFRAEVPARTPWSLAIHIAPLLGDTDAAQVFPGMDESFTRILDAHHHWETSCTEIRTDDAQMNTLIRQSLHDLRLTINQTGDGLIPVAGIPWFAVPFGRDSLITSLQTLCLNPEIARGTLRFLAKFQGQAVDAWRDEEPGKILHEIRTGELAALREVPHTPYYASIDATPLFIYLLVEYVRWTGDWDLASELRPNLERALKWIHTFGDRDADGLLEYQSQSPSGMRHHAWKDSFDAVQFADGQAAEVPIAPIEVQGYAYAAEIGMAAVYEHWGETAEATQVRRSAERRKLLFDQAYWMDSAGFYAQALDANKVQIPAITSNPGHCLLMDIIPPARAEFVAGRLLEGDILSGWGVRTLSSAYPSFNPMSYHNGSVWPHDNSLIVAGLRHTGHDAAALAIMSQVFEAGLRFPDHRLPELYCGFTRDYRYQSSPAGYPTAYSPQAWAAASVFLMLQHLLGIEPDLPNQTIRLRPALLPWLNELHFEGLRLGNRRLTVHVWREGLQIRSTVDGAEGLTITR